MEDEKWKPVLDYDELLAAINASESETEEQKAAALEALEALHAVETLEALNAVENLEAFNAVEI